MFEYIKTKTYDSLTVSSIVTVMHMNLRNTEIAGESHNFPEIIYIADGYNDLPLDGKILCLKSGQLVIVAPNTFHGASAGQKVPGTATQAIISFESNSPLLTALYNRAITLDRMQAEEYMKIIDDGRLLFENARFHETLGGMKLRDNAAPYDLEALKKRLELFLLDLYRADIGKTAGGKNRKEMSSFTDYLMGNITQNISVQEMARSMQVSPQVLRRMVHEQYGCSPLQLFIHLKINEAKRLMGEREMNITQISLYLGFESIHYFSRQFKARVGKSPSEYVRDIRNDRQH